MTTSVDDSLDILLEGLHLDSPIVIPAQPGPSKRILLADPTPEAYLLKASLEEIAGTNNVTHVKGYFDWVHLADKQKYDAYVIDPSLPMAHEMKYGDNGLAVLNDLLKLRTNDKKIWVHGSNIHLLRKAETAPLLHGRVVLPNVYIKSIEEAIEFRNTPEFLRDLTAYLRTPNQMGPAQWIDA